MKCRNCGNDFDGNFCPYCGTKVSVTTTETAANDTVTSKSGDSVTTSPDSGTEKNTGDSVTEIIRGAAVDTINWRLKFIFIGAFGAGIFMLVQGVIASEIILIILGIIMLVLGVLLMPFMTKRYKKRYFYLLCALAIVCASLAASIHDWDGTDRTDTSNTDTAQTQNIEEDDSNNMTVPPEQNASPKPEIVTDANDEYIFPHSDTEEIDIKDLQALTDKQLMIARNEIYARHGRQFQTEWLQEYFDLCSWYAVNRYYNYDNEDSMLNAIELHNVKVIADYENSLK